MRAWYEEPWSWFAALGGLVVLVATPKGKSVMSDAVSKVGTVFKGPRMSQGLFLESLGIVTTSPEYLRAQASEAMGESLTNDVYALARMIRSEGAKQGEVRAHVALNDLETLPFLHGSLFGLLTYSTDEKRRGLYGAQWSKAVPPKYPTQNARRYATIQDPFRSDIELAKRVLSDRAAGVDKSQGATKFIDKSGMGGVQPGSKSFESVNSEWVKGGYVPFQLAEYGDDLVLYRPKKRNA